MIINIAVTRFNEMTWREQCLFIEKNSLYYNSPSRITDNIPIDNYLIVLEMHNDENKIMGIGVIKNYILQKRKKIFADQNYNRYTYKSLFRINRTDLDNYDEGVMKFFDVMCFKGKKHLKRGKGIQRILNNIINNCKSVLYFPNYFINLFEKSSFNLKKLL